MERQSQKACNQTNELQKKFQHRFRLFSYKVKTICLDRDAGLVRVSDCI